TSYTVTFDPANGSEKTKVTVTAGGKVTKPQDPVRSGYTFKGWYAADSGEAFDFNTVISADITLTAKWEAEQTKTSHTVTFDPANGSSKTTVTVTAGGKVTKPADPVRSGYTFKGWYAAGSTAAFDFNITITADITLTAVWEKTAGQDTNPAAIQISASKITVAKAVYSGKALKPKVTVTYNGVTLKEKTDYTLKYSNNKKVGQGSVAVTGKGNYTGSKTVKFNILPKANKISKLTNKKGKKLVVKFSKSTGAKGYEVSYSTNKKFKSAKKKTTKKSSITLIKLKKGKTYYVRVRPYAKIGKKNVYGAYSKAVRIKIVK
ncbi:MAG: InlB B-repeat-containing protein, partial [Lachnospiraceae bacterium]|nr:InlB B-repeat-containing protein [Lachnospiraceae bacterium]